MDTNKIIATLREQNQELSEENKRLRAEVERRPKPIPYFYQTSDQRRQTVIQAIREKTARDCQSKETATAALIDMGLLLPDGSPNPIYYPPED